MSNPLAIAAVTATLRNLLTQGITPDPNLSDTTVTMHPPDQARSTGISSNQLNLFLYLATPAAAWRNMDMPRQVRDGETGHPPLALSLFYLLTAYGRDNDAQQPFSHILLGRAMSILHDHPVLGAAEIATGLQNNDLGAQIERVRLTLQPLSLEELSKLWTAFQTEYRLCAAYEAAVVLIDSTRSLRTPLPVLRRGPQDRGALAQASLTPPYPQIIELLPGGGAELGDNVTILGHHLDGERVQVRISSPRLSAPRILAAAAGGTESRVAVSLPRDAAVPAGFYTLAVIVASGTASRETNEVPLVIAPTIVAGLPATVKQGTATIKLTVLSTIAPNQTAVLLLGDQAIPAAPLAVPGTDLTFLIGAITAGTYLCRLRVDGVNSNLLVDRTAQPPAFDSVNKIVTITP